jgi:tol-pal system protein YbgF
MDRISQLKKISFPILILLLALVTGCATTGDLRRLDGSLNQKLLALQLENEKLKKEIEANRETLKPIRKTQADTGADLIEIRDNVKALKGAVEELKRDMAVLDRKDKEARLSEILFRLNFLENFIGVSKKGEPDDDRKDSKSPANYHPQNGKPDRENAYAIAYKEFKEGKYDEARRDFQKFLETFPKAEYSDNAQVWLGQCYYVEGKYEKAILEYEKVIKNFSNSDKAPNALLKQGQSFLKLKDKESAKLILQQVIKDYPNTNQARIARAKLAEIK